MSPRRLAIVSLIGVLVVPALSGCGGDSEDAARDEVVPLGPSELVATLPDGTKITFDTVEIQCVPSYDRPDVELVRVIGEPDRRSRLIIEAFPPDVEGGKTFELPLHGGDQGGGPTNVMVFVGSAPGVEASSTEEGASGEIEVVRASCNPVELELRVDATLGSELSDSGTVQVEGRLVAGGDKD